MRLHIIANSVVHIRETDFLLFSQIENKFNENTLPNTSRNSEPSGKCEYLINRGLIRCNAGFLKDPIE